MMDPNASYEYPPPWPLVLATIIVVLAIVAWAMWDATRDKTSPAPSLPAAVYVTDPPVTNVSTLP